MKPVRYTPGDRLQITDWMHSLGSVEDETYGWVKKHGTLLLGLAGDASWHADIERCVDYEMTVTQQDHFH